MESYNVEAEALWKRHPAGGQMRSALSLRVCCRHSRSEGCKLANDICRGDGLGKGVVESVPKSQLWRKPLTNAARQGPGLVKWVIMPLLVALWFCGYSRCDSLQQNGLASCRPSGFLSGPQFPPYLAKCWKAGLHTDWSLFVNGVPCRNGMALGTSLFTAS